MKTKLKPILSLLLGFGLIGGLSSCSDERELNGLKPSDPKGDFPISINLRGVTTSEPKTYGAIGAEAFESNLTTTHALIFSEESKYLGIRPVTVSDVRPAGDATHDTKAKATFDLGSSLGSDGKTIRFVLVGNLDTSDFTTNLEKLRVAQSKTSINDLTLDDIKMLHITQAPDRQNHFVMLGQPQGGGVASVTVRRNIPQEYAGVIDMERLSARIDVKIGAGTNNAGLQVTGVKLIKKQGHSYLYEKGGNSSGASLTSGEEASVMYSESPFEKKIYTYENSVAEATYVEVSLSLNGVALKPVTVPFTGKAIERNHIYTVSLDRDPADNPDINPDINQPRIMFKVDVNDWNVDYRYLENYADEEAPYVVKVTGYNYGWTEELLADAVRHTTENSNTLIRVSATGAYNMLLDVESKSTQSVGVIIEGSEWMSLQDVTTYSAGMQQKYRLSLSTISFSDKFREGKIEFRNKLKPEHKVTVTVIQGDKPGTHIPPKPLFKLPLDYVAEYNVNVEGNGFATSHANNASGLFLKGDVAVRIFDKPEFDKGYHLPSAYEWLGIIPAQGAVYFDHETSIENVSEKVLNQGDTEVKTYMADYKTVKEGDSYVTYGIRYRGNDNIKLSAWRYSYEKNPDGEGKILAVRCLYLGQSFTGTLDQIADASLWETHRDKVTLRYFPAAGYHVERGYDSPSELMDVNTVGIYDCSWYHSLDGVDYGNYPEAGAFLFGSREAMGFNLHRNSLKTAIRPFVGVLHPGLVIPTTDVKTNPLSLVAEYNVNADGTDFTNSHIGSSGYFTQDEADVLSYRSAFEGYHVPDLKEWAEIFPIPSKGENISSFDKEFIKYNLSEAHSYASGDFKSVKEGGQYVLYAHRNGFAFRYNYEKNPDGGAGEVLRIASIYTGDKYTFKGSISDIAHPEFWETVGSKADVRYFPLSGYYEAGSQSIKDRNLSGGYWCSQIIDIERREPFDDKSHAVTWHKNGIFITEKNALQRYPLRLFRGNKEKIKVSDKPVGIRLPLERVAEYNVNKEGSGFVTTHANNVSGFHTGAKVDEYISKPVFSAYEIPTQFEFYSIFPKDKTRGIERVRVESLDIDEYSAGYLTRNENGASVDYACRYMWGKKQHNLYQSAWRYSVEDNPHGQGKVLAVRAIYLGEKFKGGVRIIANPIFWKIFADRVIVRYFPLSGKKSSTNTSPALVGERGEYLMKENIGIPADRAMILTQEGGMSEQTPSYGGGNVRLFLKRKGGSGSDGPTIPDKPVGLKLPLEYMAEYEVNSDGTNLASSGRVGDFHIFDATYLFQSPALSKYHLPKVEELRSVFASGEPRQKCQYGNEPIREYGEEVKLIKNENEKYELYAIRYVGHGNTMLSAWRYTHFSDGLVIQCLYLGPHYTGSLEDIANARFWEKNKSKVVTRRVTGIRWATVFDKDDSGKYNSHGVSFSLGEKGPQLTITKFDTIYPDRESCICRVLPFEGATPKLVPPTLNSRVKSPLEYVAEYNVSRGNPDRFAKSHNNAGQSFYFLEEVQRVYVRSRMPDAFKGYHVPSRGEWRSILMPEGSREAVPYTSPVVYSPVIATSQRIFGEEPIFTEKGYALRFSKSEYCSAWRYSNVPDPGGMGTNCL